MAAVSRLRLLLFGTALCLARCSEASPVTKPGANVTVRLFQNEGTERLQVRSRDVSFRLCPTCVIQRGPLVMDLERSGLSIIDGTHRSLQMLDLDGEVEVTTASGHHAAAAGHWRIYVDHDRLGVRVEVSRERYVAAVLAAEASPGEPAESLKALAVVARSFAAATATRHEAGALCDTTHCQALRFEPVPQSLRDAVWDTSGETLWWKGKQVAGYFSQHCGGFTEDAATLWGGTPQPWLAAHADAWCTRVPSAWHASLSEKDVRDALLAEGFAAQSAVQQIMVMARDRSGRVEKVQVRFAESSRTLPAATLRFALNRSLGWNQLRSDRYQVQRIGDRFIFQGSGFGHGVGLCQSGAAAMARAGRTYRDILQSYFGGAALRVLPQDAGWTTLALHGFSLRYTLPDQRLEQAALSAFADAASRWGAPVKASPTVTVFPSTEAFRQATGRPGWELAATQGDRIATQSPDVLATHEGMTLVLRHEFLHTFAEHEASSSAPLWLREGIVAMLNGEVCPDQTAPSAEQVEAGLRTASSLTGSQQAHVAACSLTKRLVSQRGMVAVRAMLQGHP